MQKDYWTQVLENFPPLIGDLEILQDKISVDWMIRAFHLFDKLVSYQIELKLQRGATSVDVVYIHIYVRALYKSPL